MCRLAAPFGCCLMPGWIIQGVRGEGKSLCAVGKAKEYLTRGCPVATNLDLYLENLVDSGNKTVAYRLPDHPRAEDFALLPPAYDPKYKAEDKNGLLILDELALWMNCRAWNAKGRDSVINWLLLSRKNHWDLILLCQDHEIIDSQVKTTCCDYLVQASRTDRRKIPFIAPFLEFFFISAYMPKMHLYDVYYGLNYADSRVEQWRFTGRDLYDAYDTNQRFTDGTEIVGNDKQGRRAMDMRATYSYLPAAYLSKRIFTDRLQAQIDEIRQIKLNPAIEGGDMAKAKNNKADGFKMKAVVLSVFLFGFVVWRVFATDLKIPGASSSVAAAVAPAVTPAVESRDDAKKDQSIKTVSEGSTVFLDRLMVTYRPRLSAFMASQDKKGDYRIQGIIEFFDASGTIVERFTIPELKAFGCAFIVKPYGADIVTGAGTYPVTAWPKNKPGDSAIVYASNDKKS